MSKSIIVVIFLCCIVGVLIVVSNLKGEQQTLQARYLMLSCEKCYHMEVEKSSIQRVVKNTIIPRSTELDIEQLIDSSLEKDNKLFCFKGRAQKYNINLFGIDPDGIVFFVEEVLDIKLCESI